MCGGNFEALKLLENKIYHYRRIQYLLNKIEFQGIAVPIQLVEKGDSREVEEYLKIQIGLECFNMKELRDKAAILRVSPIFGLTKAELILKIREKQNESAKAQAKPV